MKKKRLGSKRRSVRVLLCRKKKLNYILAMLLLLSLSFSVYCFIQLDQCVNENLELNHAKVFLDTKRKSMLEDIQQIEMILRDIERAQNSNQFR